MKKPAGSLAALCALAALAALVLAPSAGAQCPTASIEQVPDAHGFGSSLSTPDGRLLIGASATTGTSGLPGCGAAYLCEWHAAGFAVTEELESPTPALHGFFGARVVLQGDEALVSAPGEFTGQVHVFRRVASDWVSVQKLVPSDAAPFDGFGCSLDVDGDRMAVGSWGADGVGAAYVFERQPSGDWAEVQRLDPSGPYQNLIFGENVSLSGDRVLVSARQSGVTLPGTGAVYLFERGPHGWLQRQRVVGSDSVPGDSFGYSAVLDGDLALVGAVGHVEGGQAGAVYAFDLSSGLLVETQELAAPLASSAAYGSPLALDGDRLAVGAITKTYFGGDNYVHLYRRSGGAWVDDSVLTDEPKTGFGASVRWTAHGLVVGVSGTAGVGAPDDRVQLFTLDGEVALAAGAGESSASAGATQSMLVTACPSLAGSAYVVAGSIHGAGPTPVGGVSVPLAFDGYTLTTLVQSAAVMTSGVGTLGASGRAKVELHLPPLLLPEFVGLELLHAAILFDASGPTAASNATRLVLLP